MRLGVNPLESEMKGADNGHIKRFLASTIEGTTLKKRASLECKYVISPAEPRRGAHGESSPKFASLTMRCQVRKPH